MSKSIAKATTAKSVSKAKVAASLANPGTAKVSKNQARSNTSPEAFRKASQAFVPKAAEAAPQFKAPQASASAAPNVPVARKAGDAMAFSLDQMSKMPLPQAADASVTSTVGKPGNEQKVILTAEQQADAENKAKFEAELAELMAKHNITAPPIFVKAGKAKAVRADKVAQNGITRPAATSLCGKIWATADAISEEMRGVCTISQLKNHAEIVGTNDHTIKTQYARWRAFNGISGRLPTVPAVHQDVAPLPAEGEAAPEAPAAE